MFKKIAQLIKTIIEENKRRKLELELEHKRCTNWREREEEWQRRNMYHVAYTSALGVVYRSEWVHTQEEAFALMSRPTRAASFAASIGIYKELSLIALNVKDPEIWN